MCFDFNYFSYCFCKVGKFLIYRLTPFGNYSKIIFWTTSLTKLPLLSQTDMMTRAELAFSALDKNKKGYITAKELMKLTKKLSKEELMNLMAKVTL